MKASVRDLHLRTSALLKEVEKGQVIVIEKRGVPIAELKPLTRISREQLFQDLDAIVKELPRTKTDSTKVVSDIRER